MGIILSIMTGPILFAILDQSIRNGKRAGISFASGIWVSDVLFTIACFVFYDYLGDKISRVFIFKYIAPIGILLLVGFGINQLRSAAKDGINHKINTTLKKGAKRKAWLMGFTMNVFNPFTILFWIGLVIYYSTGVSLTRGNFITFVIAMMITIITLDIGKVVLAGYIRKKLNPKSLHYIKIATGWVFIISAIVIAAEVLIELEKMGWSF